MHGEEFKVVVVDRAGNLSSAVTVKAPLDDTAPVAASNLVFSEDGSSLSGVAEPNTFIQIFDQNGQQVNTWNQSVNADGTFTISFGTYNLHGEEFTVTVKDRAGNVSEAVSVKAPLDDIAPNPIEHIIFNENGQSFTAQAEANSFISVKNAAGEFVGYGYVDSTGNVTGQFSQVYLKGEELTFIVIDKAGNQSIEFKQNALIDDIAPNPIENIVLDENGQNFTAQADVDSRIEVKNNAGEVIGSGYVDSAGNVSGSFYKLYLNGEELTFVVVDRAGNRSAEVKLN